MNYCALKSMARQTGIMLMKIYVGWVVIGKTWEWFFAEAFQRYAVDCCRRDGGTIDYFAAGILFVFACFIFGIFVFGVFAMFREWYKSEAKACESKKGRRP